MTNPTQPDSIAWGQPEQQSASHLIELALTEDLGDRGDVTSLNSVDAKQQGEVQIVARKPGVLSGLPIVPLVLEHFDQQIDWTPTAKDGDPLKPGDSVGTLSGAAQSIFTAERTILNFLCHLSGVATMANRFVQAVAGTRAHILDTRKTLPGYRLLQKYAVRCGGGRNHRMGLYDAAMLKDNHLAALSDAPPSETVQDLRDRYEGLKVIVEVDTLKQLVDVLTWKPDVVLLDNMTLDELREAVQIRDSTNESIELEASGGVNFDTVSSIAATGVDRISVGALTHSAPALDLGFDWISRTT